MADDFQAFLFDVERWFASVAQQRMSFSEKGVYLSMMFQQWRSKDRSLPDNPADVADLIAVTPAQAAEVEAAWDVVRRKFVTSTHTVGRMFNVEIENTRRKQRAARKGKAEAGREGGKARAAKIRQAKQIAAVANVAAPHSATAEPSSAQAKPSDKREKLGEERNGSGEREMQTASVSRYSPSAPKGQDPFTDPIITERAGRFIERYQALYQQHRHGAKYALKPGKDYDSAVHLCATWDDDRLDKLATIFLNTNHHFAEEGSRTITQFLAMASWCDGLLAAEEAKKARRA